MFNNYSEIKPFAEKFIEYRLSSWFLLSVAVPHELYLGLASFRIFRETKNDDWMERGKKCREKMTKWKDRGTMWGFSHKADLLCAEECYSNGDFIKAKVFYDRAIVSAKAHKFMGEEALACELAANFHLDIGCTSLSLNYFMLAHETFLEWGAFSKSNLLYETIQEKFGVETIQEKFGDSLALTAAARSQIFTESLFELT